MLSSHLRHNMPALLSRSQHKARCSPARCLGFDIYFVVADIIPYVLFVSMLFSTLKFQYLSSKASNRPNYITGICVYVSYHMSIKRLQWDFRSRQMWHVIPFVMFNSKYGHDNSLHLFQTSPTSCHDSCCTPIFFPSSFPTVSAICGFETWVSASVEDVSVWPLWPFVITCCHPLCRISQL